jgi:chromosome segregation ATPase
MTPLSIARMDLRTAARIKAYSRLRPAKDVCVAFAELLNAADPEKFSKARSRLILAIDSAEAEHQILSNEITVINELVAQWNMEIEMCQKDVQAYQSELVALDEERETIERKIEKLEELNGKKMELMRANAEGLIADTSKVANGNQDMEREIASIEQSNDKRKIAMDDILCGFRKFFLDENNGSIDHLEDV